MGYISHLQRIDKTYIMYSMLDLTQCLVKCNLYRKDEKIKICILRFDNILKGRTDTNIKIKTVDEILEGLFVYDDRIVA